jgi:hypothetical protein
MKIIDDIKSTKAFSHFSGLSNSVSRETFEKYEKDIQRMQKLRLTFYTSDERLLSTMTEDMSYRSRAIHIQIACKKYAHSLEEAIDTISNFIRFYIKDKVKGNISEKNSVIALAVHKQQELLNYIYNISNEAELLINDIDQVSWTRKNLIALLELKTRPEFKAE